MHKIHIFDQKKLCKKFFFFYRPTLPYFFSGPLQETKQFIILGLGTPTNLPAWQGLINTNIPTRVLASRVSGCLLNNQTPVQKTDTRPLANMRASLWVGV